VLMFCFQLSVQSVPIPTNIENSNLIHCEVYLQHYVIKFVSDLFQLFSPGTLVSSTNKTDCLDIAEILLKVVSNTITLTPYP
jgi:hypothetical protein